jgi:hypothetical protein
LKKDKKLVLKSKLRMSEHKKMNNCNIGGIKKGQKPEPK